MNHEKDKQGAKFFWIAISASVLAFAIGIIYLVYLIATHPPNM